MNVKTRSIPQREFEKLIAKVQTVKRIKSLEQLWLDNFQECAVRQQGALRIAVRERGWEIAATHRFGKYVPKVEQTRSRIVISVGDESYRSGSWGNGAGFRWAMEGVRNWYFQRSGLRHRRDSDVVLDWVMFGMPHRSLSRLTVAKKVN